jgi:peptidoglycan/xylan/chitin deacetylase (PgdA/CDA1 family)
MAAIRAKRGREGKPAVIVALLLAALALASPARANEACANPGALGTSRVLSLGTDGLEAGLKTYPRGLPLADHELVLTFDDGPAPGTTPKILAALRHECVRATFFLIGRNAAAHPALVRQEVADGDTIAHHSFSHPAVTLRHVGDEAARHDIIAGIEADETAAGLDPMDPTRPRLFRFPGFADTPALLSYLAQNHVGVLSADIWASDWEPMTPSAELALLLGRIEKAGRGIVLLHDIKAQTAAMLPDLLAELKRRHYSIVALAPASGPGETVAAPAGWRSETEGILARLGRHSVKAKPHPGPVT